MDGSHSRPTRFMNTGLLDGQRPSGSQVIGLGAPPVRNASTTSASRRDARTSSTLIEVANIRLVGSASTGTWPSGNRYRPGSTTSTRPAAAWCASHSRAYRSAVPVRAASSADVSGPSASAR
jgi:hypothetical protein